MGRVIRLSESDLTRIVRRIISEQEQQELVMNLVNSPKLKDLADQAISNLSARELISIKNNLNNVGIDENPSLSDAVNAGNIAVQKSTEDGEISEDDEKLTFVDRVKMGLGSLGFMNTALLGSLGTSLIEKITNYANIDTSSSAETAISFAIGIVLLLVGNTVYDKLKRIKKF
jgi:acetolactate synthase small subunit